MRPSTRDSNTRRNASRDAGFVECENKFKTPYVVRQRQWERKQRQERRDLRDKDFPPLQRERSVSRGPQARRDRRDEDFPPLRMERNVSRGPLARGGSSTHRGRSLSRQPAPGNQRWKTAGRAAPSAQSISRRRGDMELIVERERSRSRGGPVGGQRGATVTRWVGPTGLPKLDLPIPPPLKPRLQQHERG